MPFNFPDKAWRKEDAGRGIRLGSNELGANERPVSYGPMQSDDDAGAKFFVVP